MTKCRSSVSWDVLVHREMERGRSPLVSVPPFGAGIVKAPTYTDSMRIWKQRKEQVPALPFIVSDEPTRLSLGTEERVQDLSIRL